MKGFRNPSDYHVHSCFSGDSTFYMEEYCDIAINKGLKALVFTEHLDVSNPSFKEIVETAAYLSQKYKNRLSILSGTEINYNPGSMNNIGKLIQSAPLDFVLLGIHDVGEIDITKGNYFTGKSSFECYEKYFLTVYEAIEQYTNYDVFAHIDLVRRYDSNAYKANYQKLHKDIIDEILKLLIQNGKGIEINTSGYRYNINSTLPDGYILRRYRELGGEILTLGSDAHSPDFIGYKFSDVYRLLEELGFRYLSKFKLRKCEYVKI